MTTLVREGKLTPGRLTRRAIVYVRQSSRGQVEHNRESQRLQYALVERARALGWTRVDVIDDDLGASAAVASARREGFERLLAAVALDDVGIVLSREASRLSRTDRDWCRLCEICQVFDTLIGDADQIYDLSTLDDQLVLGIKGTLSVVELKVLRQRLLAGQYSKAGRGEYYTKLASGYVLDADRRLVKDPNALVQQAVALVFSTFRRTASIRQTLLWFREHGVEIPVNVAHGGKFRLVFQRANQNSMTSMLHNPTYAGAYVYGRRVREACVVDGVPTKRVRRVRSPEEARVFLRDHHEGYISWAEWEENQRIMSKNSRRWDQDENAGAARAGMGLLVGLLRCGLCGRKLRVHYGSINETRYLCPGDHASGGSRCISFSGARPDHRLGEEILSVLSPLGIAASIEAIERLEHRDDDRRALLDKQIEQATYEAQRAFEQYDQVDARNRLVASELEARWNEKLRAVEAATNAITQLDAVRGSLTDDERIALRDLGTHFRDVWTSPLCPPEVKKRIARAVIKEIIVSAEVAATLSFVIHWSGGVHTRIEMPKPTIKVVRGTPDDTLDIIRRLAVRYGDAEIARVLTRLGRCTGTGRRFSEELVRGARARDHIPGQMRTQTDPDILTLNAAAKAVGVSDGTIRRLVAAGVLPCTRVVPMAQWEIRRQDLDAAPVRAQLDQLRRTGKLALCRGADDAQQSLFPENQADS